MRGIPPSIDACSLIQYRGHVDRQPVDYVHLCGWQSSVNLYGKIFLEDESGHLKWSVPSVDMFKNRSYAGCDVILPDAGAAPSKPIFLRPKVPSDTITIKRVFRAAVHTSSVDCNVSTASCLVCGSASSSSASTLTTCGVCLVTSHRDTCLRKSLMEPDAKELLLSHVLDRTVPIQLPSLFSAAALCSVCRLVSSPDASAFNNTWASSGL